MIASVSVVRARQLRLLSRFTVLLLSGVGLWMSLNYLNVHVERFEQLFQRLGVLFANRYYPPDLEYITRPGFLKSVLETIHMAFLAALIGLLVSAPLAWLASFNVSPFPKMGYPLARLLITTSRAIHEMIWAIIFVMIVGYGVLAGVIALTLSCIGFSAKLFAEEIESIAPGPVEAVKASGASPLGVFLFGVLPQVKTAWIGISIYTWDVVFRASTVVGFVGAGGMGWYLRRAADQLQSDRVAAIVLLIVALVACSELFSFYARKRFHG
ncbi:MAG: phosphonate ABC transporter, permease protein PhnE [Candidatus Competibacteraceae bacterium]|nr:MAG: phosphonate ABC transporter, permease protein PhnE [Candidatus Competibacteraceae bacterium]